MPLIPVLRRQRQANLCEFEASLVYKSKFQDRLQSFEKPCFKKPKKKKEQEKKRKCEIALNTLAQKTTF